MTQRNHRKDASDLLALPGIGPATVGDLQRLGITRLEQLVGRDPQTLYDALGALDNAPHDICVRDVFESLIAHADGEPLRPWWEFSRRRKAQQALVASRQPHQHE